MSLSRGKVEDMSVIRCSIVWTGRTSTWKTRCTHTWWTISTRRHHKATAAVVCNPSRWTGKLPMSIVPSTPQTNWNDSGVYAATYATELASGYRLPGLQTPYDAASMREVFGAGRYDAISSYRDARRAHGKRRKVVRRRRRSRRQRQRDLL